MPYTVWSRGRLLGASELEYAEAIPGVKAGDFEPSAEGETLMPVLVGAGPAIRALSTVLREQQPGEPGEDRIGGAPLQPHGDGLEDAQGQAALTDTILRSTEYADYLSLCDELENLALELRDASGAVVPTEWVTVQDTEYLRSLAREDSDWPEEDPLEPWEPAPARYQLMVMMQGHAGDGAPRKKAQ